MTILRVTRREFLAALGSAAAYPIIAAAILTVSAIWPSPAEAHDIYTSLTEGSGASCCSGKDCRSAHYRITTAGVEMLVGGDWILIPDSKIQYRTLEGDKGETAGGALVWRARFRCDLLRDPPPARLLLAG
jgi:hypothetical protein